MLLAVVLGAAAPAWAAEPTPRSVAQRYTYTFQDADLSVVAEEVLGQGLGLGYRIDAGVAAKVAFRIDQRLTPAQLLEAFENALAAQDIVLVREGERLLITSRSKAKGSTTVRGPGGASGGYRMMTPTLALATPSEAAKNLQAMGLGDVVITADDKTGTLVIGGTNRELQAAQEALQLFDRPASGGSRNRLVEVRNADAAGLASELSEVLKAAGISGVQVATLERRNALLLFGRNDRVLDEAERWIGQLDTPLPATQSTLWVYKPKNVSAEALSLTLNQVLGNSVDAPPVEAPRSPSSPALTAPSPGTIALTGPRQAAVSTPVSNHSAADGAAVRVSVDRDSNSLVIFAPATRRPELQRLLQEIDVLPRQVLIEASILEVTLTNEFRLGVNWSILANNGRFNIIQSNDRSGAISPTFPGIAITYFDNNVEAAVDALQARTTVKVVSAPKLVALDNRVARLQIGDQVPIATETSQSTSTGDAPRLVTIDYRNTGVILEVTPRITGEDGVTLNVSQEVSSVARTTTSGIDSPTIQQRRFDSVLLLKSGNTVALGGLISSTNSGDDNGVPVLSDIPVLGSLFKSQNRDRRRTELVVLLSARILPDAAASATAAGDITAQMQSIDSHGIRDRK